MQGRLGVLRIAYAVDFPPILWIRRFMLFGLPIRDIAFDEAAPDLGICNADLR